MLNFLWAFMILIGVLWGAVHGNLSLVTAGVLKSAQEAVALCITMLGVMSFWTGILKIGEEAGLIEQLSAKLSPVLSFLFPRLPKDHPARKQISVNMIANMLGLGWAATPAGLKAMEELAKLEDERIGEQGGRKPPGIAGGHNGLGRKASKEMCTFLIINISSLQLIPVNMIAYRSQYGSVNPAAIVGPAIAATLISTLVGVVYCKIMDRGNRNSS